MVTMAQSVVNWRNTHTHIYNYIARIHSHTYINTVTTTLYEAPAQQKFGIIKNIILKVPEGKTKKIRDSCVFEMSTDFSNGCLLR